MRDPPSADSCGLGILRALGIFCILDLSTTGVMFSFSEVRSIRKVNLVRGRNYFRLRPLPNSLRYDSDVSIQRRVMNY